MKIRGMTERIDVAEREQQASLESISVDLKSLRAQTVTNQAFRQQNNIVDKRIDHEKDETEAKIEQLKLTMEKEIASGIGNLRLKAETLNANCIALTEKSRVLEETLIPSLKLELEEQKQKRLCETQRLESEIEKMKELCEQKISHTAAALRFFVTATSTKLREELAPLTMTKELEEDLKQKDYDMKQRLKVSDENMNIMKAEIAKQKADVEAHVEKTTGELGQHTKAIKVQEIMVTNLQNSIASDLNDQRETMRSDRAQLQNEIADSRASATRAALTNDTAIQAVANEIGDLRKFREVMVERLHVEKVIGIVREWQTGHIPQITSAVKDLEEKSRKLTNQVSKDHDLLQSLHASNTAIKGHFKLFQAIAAGPEDRPSVFSDPMAGLALEKVNQDARLPPLPTARSPGGSMTVQGDQKNPPLPPPADMGS